MLGALLLFAAVSYRKKKHWNDISISMPGVLRTDLHYVYYLSEQGQMAKTGDHTDLFWHGQFYGPEQLQTERAME